MAKNSHKWLRASPHELAGMVAQRAVGERLEEVWKCLAKAATKKRHKKRRVHELRVAARRAEAACEVFEDFLPPRRVSWIRTQLDKLRHATGEARDLDVLADSLPAEMRGLATDELARQVRKRGQAARRPIVKLFERLKREDGFEHRRKKLARKTPRVDKLHAKLRKIDFEEFSSLRLVSLVTEFFQAEPAGGWDRAEWHAYRLTGKALRYGLELLAPALPLSARTEIYPLLGELQDRLGEINDLATADELLRDCVRHPSSDSLETLDRLADDHQSQLSDKRRAFESWYHGGARDALWTGLNQSAQQDHFGPLQLTALE